MISVACLMPTMLGREQLFARAVKTFVLQEYPKDWNVSIVVDPDEGTLGAKLNRMIEANPADFYVLLDDDDEHSPTRVQRQVEPLLRGYELTGTSKIFYKDIKTGKSYLYSGNPAEWLGGMAFKRGLWERLKFEDRTKGVDTIWQRALKPLCLDIADPALFIAGIHDTNSGGKKDVTGQHWSQV